MQQVIARRAGKPVTLGVERDGKTLDVTVTPADESEVRELDIVEHEGRIGFDPRFPAAVIGVARPDSPAARAKLQTFDQITAINGRRIERFVESRRRARARTAGTRSSSATCGPSTCRRRWAASASSPSSSPASRQLTPLAAAPGGHAACATRRRARPTSWRARASRAPTCTWRSCPRRRASGARGCGPGDRITTPRRRRRRGSGRTMEDELVAGADRRHELTWTRDGMPMRGFFQLRKEQWDDEFGQHFERYVFRSDDWLPNAPDRLVPNPHPLAYALRRGIEETRSVIKFISIGVLRLAQGRLSLSSVSGPITLYDIAGQAGAKGPEYFVRAVALISVNVGIINLLPIPVLDGGHLLFFLFEAARRRPLASAHPRGGEPGRDGRPGAPHDGGVQERRRAPLGRHRHPGAGAHVVSRPPER